MKLIFALFPLILAAQPNGSNTQLQVQYWCSSPAASTLEVSPDSGISALVNDVNTALFPGSNAANRAGNAIIGNKVIFNVGTRISPRVTATVNSVQGPSVSRALQANTPYWYRITGCGTPAILGPVFTGTIAIGNTWLDPIPPATDTASKAWTYEGWLGYPDFTRWLISDTTANLETNTDSQTGAAFKRATMPVNAIGDPAADWNFVAASGANWVASDSGTLLHAVSIDDGIYVHANTSDWLSLTINSVMIGKNGGSDADNQSMLSSLVANVKAWYTTSANNAEVALSVNGGVSVWPTSTNVYTTALGNTPLPSTFATYGSGSQSMYPWTPAGQQPLMSGDGSFRSGQVTVDVSGNVSWVLNTGGRRTRFYQGWTAGTPMAIGSSLCTLTAYSNPEQVAINPAACIPALSVPITVPANYSAGGITLMIRKPVAVTDTLNVQYGKLHISYGNNRLQWASGGDVQLCNPAMKLNSVTGNIGTLCTISGYAWWFDSTTGAGNLITKLGTAPKAGLDGWSSIACPNTQAFLGTAPSSPESLYCSATDNIGKSVIVGCTLQNAAGTAPTTFQSGDGSLSCQNLTKSSTGSDISALVAAYTAGQVSVFDPTQYPSISINASVPWADSKVWLKAQRGSQDTIAWSIMFDPAKVDTAPGCVGGGLPGCVVSAKDTWSAFPDRWDGFHDISQLGNVAYVTGHGMGSQVGTPGGNFYSITMLGANLAPTPSIAAGAVNGGTTCPLGSLGCDVVTVDGEPCIISPSPASGGFPAEPLNCPKNGAQSWLQNALPGDVLTTADCITTTGASNQGCNDNGHANEVETLKILDKRGTPWSSSLVQRGFGTGPAVKLSVTNGNYTSTTAGFAVHATSGLFSPGMVGGQIYLSGSPFTVASYTDNTHLAITTDPGNHASNVPWLWPHQPGSNIVANMAATGRPFNNSSFYPGAAVNWGYNQNGHGTNTGPSTTVLVDNLVLYDHEATSYNTATAILSRVGGSNASDTNAPANSGYSFFVGSSFPLSQYLPTGYGVLGPLFNSIFGMSRITGLQQEHPSTGALGSGTFHDARMLAGPGSETLQNVTGNLWKMTAGLTDSSGDIFTFVGWSDNAICNVSGVNVSRVSGTPFSNNLTLNQTGSNLDYWINGVGNFVNSVTDANNLVLRAPGAGTQTNVPCSGGTALGGSNVLSRKLQTIGAWCGTQPLVDASGPTTGDVIGGTSADQFKWGIARRAGELRAASNQGDMYFNCPFIGPRTQFYADGPGCTQVGPEGGTTADICVGQTAQYTNAISQIGTAQDLTGATGRVISHNLTRNKILDVNANAHVTADGKYLLSPEFAMPGSEFEVLAFTIPPYPAADAIDRTRYVPVQVGLPLAGTTIPVGAVSARVSFGYAENNGFCTTRQEICYSNATGFIPNVPFLFGTTDGPVAGLACAGGCNVWVPGVPEHLVSMSAEWLDSGGSILRTDVVPPVIVAPAAFTQPPGCTLFPSSLASSTIGTPYVQTPVATGCGPGPFTWSLTGLLPGGIGFCTGATGASCTISGNPTVAGSFPITIQVTDGGSNTASMPYTIVVANSSCAINPSSLPNGTVGVAYSQTASVLGCGAGTLTWSVISGTLPTSVSICGSTGTTCLISGTPTVAGTYSFTLQVTDGAFNTATQPYTVVIASATPTCGISPASLPGGTVGVAYSQPVTATNCGGGTLTWTRTGSLPSGLSGCNSVTGSSCTIVGTPTASGIFPITIQVSDGGSNTASIPYSLSIAPTPPPTATGAGIRTGTAVTTGTAAH